MQPGTIRSINPMITKKLNNKYTAKALKYILKLLNAVNKSINLSGCLP